MWQIVHRLVKYSIGPKVYATVGFTVGGSLIGTGFSAGGGSIGGTEGSGISGAGGGTSAGVVGGVDWAMAVETFLRVKLAQPYGNRHSPVHDMEIGRRDGGDTRQTQALTPRLQHAVRLLQLLSLDYEQELHEVMDRNPFLEMDERPSVLFPSGDSLGEAGVSGQPQDGSAPPDQPGEVDSDASWDERHDSWTPSEGGIRDGA